MATELRLQVIRRAVAELAASEDDVAGKLERAQQLSSRHPDALAAIQRIRPMVQKHRERLATYLKDTGAAGPGGETAGPQTTTPRAASALSEALRDLSLTFHNCALGYAMLFEVALRLYEPRLREIAPEHMKAHADAAISTARLLPGIVAWQLSQDGLHCACICPICSVGACGCVYYGTQTLTAAWRDGVPAETEPSGFALHVPWPESQLARAGVQGGDVILAVDGQQVRDYSEAQVAFRKHALGDEIHLLVQCSSQSPRGLVVRHVSDYPKT